MIVLYYIELYRITVDKIDCILALRPLGLLLIFAVYSSFAEQCGTNIFTKMDGNTTFSLISSLLKKKSI